MLPMAAALPIAGQVLGGIFGSRSARRAGEQQAQGQRDAANIQLQGVREGNQLLSGMYRHNNQMLAPTIGAGQTSLSALMSGMGLGSLQTGRGQSQGQPGQPTFTNAQGQTVDAQGQLVTGPDLGDVPGITQEQSDAAASPYAGTFLEKFTGQDIYRDPSYGFRLSEGEKLLRARQAAGGNRWGSQAMKDITNYGQEAASQEFGNAYSRFMQQKEQLYNRLSGIAGMGQGATSQAAGLGQSTASGMSGNISQGYAGAGGNYANAGTALAGGTVGSTNALVGGINQAGNTMLARDYFNQINAGQVPRPQ